MPFTVLSYAHLQYWTILIHRYASLVGTIGKKFAKKKKVKRAKGSDEEVEKEEVPKQKKKRKFMKPPE